MKQENQLEVTIEKGFQEKLFHLATSALPHKTFGLIGGKDLIRPRTIYECKTNLRTEPVWDSLFRSYGEFYFDKDRGFVISSEEHIKILQEMQENVEKFVGVFHSHRCRDAIPSKIDIDLHYDLGVLMYIVSVVDPTNPELGIFRITQNRVDCETIYRRRRNESL